MTFKNICTNTAALVFALVAFSSNATESNTILDNAYRTGSNTAAAAQLCKQAGYLEQVYMDRAYSYAYSYISAHTQKVDTDKFLKNIHSEFDILVADFNTKPQPLLAVAKFCAKLENILKD